MKNYLRIFLLSLLPILAISNASVMLSQHSCRRIRQSSANSLNERNERFDLTEDLIRNIMHHWGLGNLFKISSVLAKLLPPHEAALFDKRLPVELIYLRILQEIPEYEGLDLFEWFSYRYSDRTLEAGDLRVIEKAADALAIQFPDMFANIMLSLLGKYPLQKFEPKKDSFELSEREYKSFREKIRMRNAEISPSGKETSYEVVSNFNFTFPELYWAVDNKGKLGTPRAVLPDGRIVVFDTSKGDLILWSFDLDTCEYDNKAVILRENYFELNALTVLPDGRLATGNVNGTIRIWDLTNNRVSIFKGTEEGAISDMAFLPDGRLVTCGYDYTIRVWDLNTKEVIILPNQGEQPEHLAVMPDGRIVSSQLNSGSIKIWDLTGETVVEFNNDKGIRNLAAFPDGKIVTSDTGGNLKVWDPDRKIVSVIKEGHTERDATFALGVLDDERVVTCDFDGSVRVWDLKNQGVLELWDDNVSIVNLLILGNGNFISQDFKKRWNIWHVE